MWTIQTIDQLTPFRQEQSYPVVLSADEQNETIRSGVRRLVKLCNLSDGRWQQTNGVRQNFHKNMLRLVVGIRFCYPLFVMIPPSCTTLFGMGSGYYTAIQLPSFSELGNNAHRPRNQELLGSGMCLFLGSHLFKNFSSSMISMIEFLESPRCGFSRMSSQASSCSGKPAGLAIHRGGWRCIRESHVATWRVCCHGWMMVEWWLNDGWMMVEWWLNGILYLLSPKIQWKKPMFYLHLFAWNDYNDSPDWMCFWYDHSCDRVKNTQYTNYTIGIPWVLISLDPFQNRNISKLKVQIPGFQLNMGPVALPLGSRPLSHQVFGRWWSDPRHQMGWMQC